MASEVNNFMVITYPQQETHHGFSIEQYRKKHHYHTYIVFIMPLPITSKCVQDLKNTLNSKQRHCLFIIFWVIFGTI